MWVRRVVAFSGAHGRLPEASADQTTHRGQRVSGPVHRETLRRATADRNARCMCTSTRLVGEPEGEGSRSNGLRLALQGASAAAGVAVAAFGLRPRRTEGDDEPVAVSILQSGHRTVLCQVAHACLTNWLLRSRAAMPLQGDKARAPSVHGRSCASLPPRTGLHQTDLSKAGPWKCRVVPSPQVTEQLLGAHVLRCWHCSRGPCIRTMGVEHQRV